jgi:hypothetical protein
MTYTPSAYIAKVQGYWYVFLHTPSGITVRLFTSYLTPTQAESAIGILGFKLVAAPTGELHQHVS